ncbi:hypothetical protein [Saccharibacillus deserti]|uniref:hypothetical protein n=1 Tax=Saccharibacillus deserti TaxID=1634444 RepID=UPI0015570063|nr:hypothetical protein [Saccharibacillus deserti]
MTNGEHPKIPERRSADPGQAEKWRVFAAVPIGSEAADRLADWAVGGFGTEAFRRWTDPRDYHLGGIWQEGHIRAGQSDQDWRIGTHNSQSPSGSSEPV